MWRGTNAKGFRYYRIIQVNESGCIFVCMYGVRVCVWCVGVSEGESGCMCLKATDCVCGVRERM